MNVLIIGSGGREHAIAWKISKSSMIKKLIVCPGNAGTELVAQNIELDIIHEDEDLVVINKRPGIVVHPGHGNYSGTLINGLIYHFENLPKNSSNRPGLVHRLDKDTSGLLVVAKNDNSMVHLSNQFANKTSKREYIAMVWGNVKDDSGRIDNYIGRNPKNRLQNIVLDEDSIGLSLIHI